MGGHSLLQGLFLTQGSNIGLLYCGQNLYCLSHQGSPKILTNISLKIHKAKFYIFKTKFSTRSINRRIQLSIFTLLNIQICFNRKALNHQKKIILVILMFFVYVVAYLTHAYLSKLLTYVYHRKYPCLHNLQYSFTAALLQTVKKHILRTVNLVLVLRPNKLTRNT